VEDCIYSLRRRRGIEGTDIDLLRGGFDYMSIAEVVLGFYSGY
jgi:hypothetical protein